MTDNETEHRSRALRMLSEAWDHGGEHIVDTTPALPDGWDAWVNAMRLEPGNAGLLLVAADWLDEREATVSCDHTSPLWDGPAAPCPMCDAHGWKSNGNSLRAEALRLLGECGVTGWSGGGMGDSVFSNRIADDWWEAALRGRTAGNDLIDRRLLLLDAYAAADLETRAKWHAETVAMSGVIVECLWCNGTGNDADESGFDQGNCKACCGTGKTRLVYL